MLYNGVNDDDEWHGIARRGFWELLIISFSGYHLLARLLLPTTENEGPITHTVSVDLYTGTPFTLSLYASFSVVDLSVSEKLSLGAAAKDSAAGSNSILRHIGLYC